ncbi:MAG: hypothetical protein HBSAPP02_01960 [Phycisphaerae bacterium]|nr:MAG: hypothetical protein DCC66_05855 [Planctomycetota bacterium]GJQ25164.1 MAG: hypothetical protein HBSAPP02_01960 [Phycisphaerae bacterium]
MPVGCVGAISSSSDLRGGLPRYWYGLPPWPGGLYAWRRQFDASAIHPGVRAGDAVFDASNRPHSYFAGRRAQSTADVDAAYAARKDEMGQCHSAVGGCDRKRLWPFRWPVVEAPRSVRQVDFISPPGIGQVLDVTA